MPYADFTLPVLSPSNTSIAISWKPVPDPVLVNGAPGEWDGVDALNPSVVRTADGLFNFYSGFDGRTWHTGLAISSDGLHWKKHGRVLSPDPKTWEGDYIAANGSVLRVNGKFHHWYQAGGERVPQIGLATSSDGRNWTKTSEPVLPTGPRGSWDERGVGDPYVIRVGETFYLYYLGQDRARRQRLGIARSYDGRHWEKLRSNPILELGDPERFDGTGLGEPAVWQSHGSYWMLYTARDRHENRRLGLARSQDGVRWQRYSRDPIFSGAYPWNAKVVCDPHVELQDGTVRVWYGGGNRPEPAENLDGQIGVADLTLTVR